MKPFFLSILLSIGIFSSFGQGYDPAKVNKKAAQLYSQGIEKAESGAYMEAIGLMDQAIKTDKQFLDAYLSRAGLYGELKKYDDAIKNYELALQMDPVYAKDYTLPYSINLAGRGKFDKALQAVDQFLTEPELNEKSRKAAEYRRKSYLFALEMQQKHPSGEYVFAPKNMGPSINTQVSEYYPALTIDGKTMIFTRRVNQYNEDFYESRFADGQWTPSEALSGNINTEQKEGAQTISQDGQLLVFTGMDYPGGFGNFDLYYSIKTRQGWSLPKNLGGAVNSETWESAPCLSPDKRDIYFASAAPGGYGGIDIYVTHRLPNGRWSDPENMGPGINTAGDESSPFIHADNQTFYFTSNSWQGYGGDDLFVVRKQADGNWSVPENLGYPINTIENEGSLVIAADGRTAYYASDREDTYGGLDIYTFDMRDDVRPLRTVWVQGKVFDKNTKAGLPSAVELTELATGNTLSRVQTDEDGEYLLTLPVGKDYLFNVNRKGYLFYSGNFPLRDKAPDSTYRMDIPLQPMELNAAVELKNIFFKTNAYTLEPASRSELDLLVKLLNENPALKIRINGHTDNVGKAADNLTLSNNRAKAVVDYLREKGIAADRLSSKGFGAGSPISDNNTEEGRARNRRTELQVTAL